jgi:hypothetical protein
MVDLHATLDGPFGLAGDHARILFDAPEGKAAGVYISAVPFHQGGYFAGYIGQTGQSFAKRWKDHMIRTMGGEYRTCDPELARRGESRVLWPGLWRKGTRDKMGEYLDRLPELAPAIRESLRSTVIFTAAIDGDRRIRERVEGALALHYREMGGQAAVLLAPDIRYRPRKDSEPPIRVRVICTVEIKGLPSELIA